MAKKSIPHLEDLSQEQLSRFAEALSQGKLEATEKVDGAAFIVFGFDEPNRVWTMPPGSYERVYDPRVYEGSYRHKAVLEAHSFLKTHLEGRFDDWLKENPNPTFGADVLNSRYPNVIEYGHPALVVHMAKSNGKLNDNELMDSFVARMSAVGGPWKVERVQRVDLGEYKGLSLSEGKASTTELVEKLKPLLKKVKPAQGPKDGRIEGIVFRDPSTGGMVKLVDREGFTALNKLYWSYREQIERGRKDESGTWRRGVMRGLAENLARDMANCKSILSPSYVKSLAKRWVGLSVDEALKGELSLKINESVLSEGYVQRGQAAVRGALAELMALNGRWQVEKAQFPPHIQERTYASFAEAKAQLMLTARALSSIVEGADRQSNRIKALKIAMGRSSLRRLRKALNQDGINEHDPFDNRGFMKDIAESITEDSDMFKLSGFSKDFDDGAPMKDTPAADVAAASDNLFKKYADKLKKKGLDPTKLKKLGNGHWGVAYDTGKGVLKISKDVDEAKASNWLKGKELKHVVKIDDVFRFPPPDDSFYGILQEKLQPISKGDGTRFDDFVRVLRKVKAGPQMMAGDIDGVLAKAKNMLDDEGVYDSFVEDVEHFDFGGIIKDLAGQRIRFTDYHSGNIMKKGENFAIIDVGVGQSPGTVPDVLERIERAVIGSLNEEKADSVAVMIGRFQPFHKGHSQTIRNLAKKFTKVIVLVAGNNPSAKNPFPFDLREKIIRTSLADVETKLEIYRAEVEGKDSGFVPSILGRLVDEPGSSLDKDTAVEIVVGPDRVADMQGQIDRALKLKQSGKMVLNFDPSLAKVTKAPEVKADGERISGTKVRELIAANKSDEVLKLMDPVMSSNKEDWDSMFQQMRDAEAKYTKLTEDIQQVGGEKGIQRILQANAGKLMKSKQIDVTKLKPLGQGHEGIAYDAGGGKVLKITADAEEAKASNKLKGKSYKSIAKIFDVFRLEHDLSPSKCYGIIEEMLTPLSEPEIDEFQKYMDFIEGPEAFAALRAGDWEAVKANIKRMVDTDVADDLGIDPKNAPPEKMAKFEEATAKKIGVVTATFEKFNLPGMLADLKSAGIQFIDFHGGNVMKRGGDYVINDLGRSKSGGAEPNVLEQITKVVLEYINVPVETDGFGSSGVGVKAGSSPWSSASRIMTKDDTLQREKKVASTDHRTFETGITKNLKAHGVKAKHMGSSPDKPDIAVQVGDVSAFIEVKMAGAQLGTPRMRYDGTKWKMQGDSTELTRKVLELMKDPEAVKFLKELQAFTKKPRIKVLSTRDKTDPSNVTGEEMKRFLAKRDTQYIVKRSDIDLTHIVAGHYADGKEHAAAYIQFGDGFYKMGPDDPLGLKNVPKFLAKGTLGVRVSVRADGRYEVIPEVKASKVNESPFSIAPQSTKKFPFGGTE